MQKSEVNRAGLKELDRVLPPTLSVPWFDRVMRLTCTFSTCMLSIPCFACMLTFKTLARQVSRRLH